MATFAHKLTLLSLIVPTLANAAQVHSFATASGTLVANAETGLRGVDEFQSTLLPSVANEAANSSEIKIDENLEAVPPLSVPATVEAPVSETGIAENGAAITTEINSDQLSEPLTEEKSPTNATDFLFAENQSGTNEVTKGQEAGAVAGDQSPEAILSATEPNLWQGATYVAFAIFGIAILGMTMVRLKRRGALAFQKQEKDMEILSTLPVGPKRQIILVKIRDQEIALASTEQGLSFLTEVIAAKPTVTRGLPAAITNKVIQARAHATEALPRAVTSETNAATHKEAVSENLSAKKPEAKSEIFLQALKSLKAKNAQAPQKKIETPEAKTQAEESGTADKTPTVKQTRASFPKYLANAFENEQKRTLTQEAEEESVESVTNMIREKLKSMSSFN